MLRFRMKSSDQRDIRVTSAQLSDGLSSAPSAHCVCPWQPNVVAGVGELMRTAERLSKQEGPG